MFLVCILFLLVPIKIFAEKSNAKQFRVVLTVQYNSITLEEAAKKEAAFRSTYKDACKIDVEIKEKADPDMWVAGMNVSSSY
jgi:hypothetical protein